MSDTHTRIEPQRSRPLLPTDYGVPDVEEGMVSWSWAVERLEQARNYWFSTTRPDGRPHAMPAWAVRVDGALYFDGSPETRRARNLALNPAIPVHLESGDQGVILEGEGVLPRPPGPAVAAGEAEVLDGKYGA